MIHRTNLPGGLPLFWAEGSEPFIAALEFRVGRADEQFVTAGITHLVEHLVLPTEWKSSVQFNGVVESTRTRFWAQGDRDEVVKLLAGICAALRSPPVERLEIERKILLTEAASSSTGPADLALLLRFGPVAHGLPGYPELGLHWLGEDEVRAWVGRSFSGANAAVWMTGPPPAGYELCLGGGERIPPPQPASIDYLTFPSLSPGGPGGSVSISFVATRSHALLMALSIAERRVRRDLRYTRGITYHIDWHYEPLTAELAHVTFAADCLDENADQVKDGVMAVFESLAADGPTEEELAGEVDAMRYDLLDRGSIPAALSFAASFELVAGVFESPEEQLRLRAAVTPGDGAASLAAAIDSALLVVPVAEAEPEGRFSLYPASSGVRVSGRRYRLRGPRIRRDDRRVAMVVSNEGISLETPFGEPVTVPFEDCVAAQRWADGTRGLWSRDGYYIEVNPAEWKDGRELVDHVDAHVPADVLVPMEKELDARIAAVGKAVEGRVKRGWLTGDELDALPRNLAGDEHVVTAARASKGWKYGVLAVTNLRLLFLYAEDLVLEVFLADVRSVRERPGSLLRDGKLHVAADKQEHTFTNIKPNERLSELSAAITPGSPASRSPPVPE